MISILRKCPKYKEKGHHMVSFWYPAATYI